MGVGAPYGNKNAEKWSIKKSIQLFNDAIELSNEQTGDKYSYDYIGEVARQLGTFKEIFSHLTNRFEALKRKHKQLITNLEANCYYNGKNNHIKEASAIMNLKSNHRWTDRLDNTTKDKELPSNVDLSKLSYEQLRELAKGNSKGS